MEARRPIEGDREKHIATVGVIDLGAMGKPISQHLPSKNCQVTEYDVKGSWAVLWNPRGFVLARDTAEVGEKSELNLVIVIDDAQVKEACLGAQGDKWAPLIKRHRRPVRGFVRLHT